MRYAFLDKTNNIVHLINDPSNLQAEFDQFADKVAQQGTLSLCVGEVHLVQMVDVVQGGLLHRDPSQRHQWRVKLSSLPTLTTPLERS